MIRLNELKLIFNDWLSIDDYDDIAKNGLQIEGKKEINRIICSTSISLRLIEEAIKDRADAIFVHHGLIWKNGIKKIDGYLKARIEMLLKNNISLFAYHLPLDAHDYLGNNIQILKILNITKNIERFGLYSGRKIGFSGSLVEDIDISLFLKNISKLISIPNFTFLFGKKNIRKIAVCSGGASSLIEEACFINADLYLTGEASEWTKEFCSENKISFIAAGHYATEVFGVKAISEKIKKELNIYSKFIRIENPF